MTRAYAALELEDIPRILRHNMSSYRDHANWDDCIQEGFIRAWRDMQEGVRDDTYIVRRAGVWAKANMTDDTKLPTGHPGRERTGVRKKTSEALYEKVQAYQEEFVRLHNRKPSVTEIANGAGVKRWTAEKYRAVHVDSAMYRENADGTRRVDRRAYNNIPLFVTSPESGDSVIHPESERDRYGTTPTLEEEVIDNVQFEQLIEGLEEDAQKVLILRFKWDYTCAEISQILGHPNRSRVLRTIRRSLAQIKQDVYGISKPDGRSTKKVASRSQSHCKEGHEMTEDNSGQQANGRGVYCRECSRVKSRARYHAAKAASDG